MPSLQEKVTVLTLEQCRKVLGDQIQLDDDALIALRAQLYTLARLAIELAESETSSNHRADRSLDGGDQ
jgi:hypothetical protein